MHIHTYSYPYYMPRQKKNNCDYIDQIILELLNCECIIYGDTLNDVLFITKKVNIFAPKNDGLQKLKTYLEYTKKLKSDKNDIEIDDNKWVINKIKFIFTNKIKGNMCLSKAGLYKMNNNEPFEILNLIRNTNNQENFADNELIKMKIDWVKNLLNAKHTIYGGWLSRYLSCTEIKELDRDIDVITENLNDFEYFHLLSKSKLCEWTESTTYKNKSIMIKLNLTDTDKLILDIHNEQLDNALCDAFYNNLKLTDKYLTVKYIPENMNYLEAFRLTLHDVINKRYTLIKSFPDKFTNNADFRLIYKPIKMFEENFVISYDWLIKNKTEHKKLADILVNDQCSSEGHNPEMKVIESDKIIKVNGESICLNCVHNNIMNSKKTPSKKTPSKKIRRESNSKSNSKSNSNSNSEVDSDSDDI